MNAVTQFWRDLTLKPQGITVVIAAFLPIIAIVAMGPAVPSMIEHFANDPDARGKSARDDRCAGAGDGIARAVRRIAG